ncbi:MAG: hypothetical protein VX777_00235 [Chlamydiota bacterium]|nr:hypothetical protein [Chlamydiota bacterium]
MTSSLPKEMTSLIDTYNKYWINNKSTPYLQTDSKSPLMVSVVTSLRTESLLSRTTSKEAIQQSYNATCKFFECCGAYIECINSNHRDFLSRIRESFTHDRCGHDIEHLDLDKKIALIRAKTLETGSSTASEEKIEFEHLVSKFLQSDLRKLRSRNYPMNCIDMVFLVGSNDFPIPAHRYRFYTREYPATWSSFLKKNQLQKETFLLVSIPNIDPTIFFSFLKIIYEGDYPEDASSLFQVSYLASMVNEKTVITNCFRTIRRLLFGKFTNKNYLDCVEFCKKEDIFNTQIKHRYCEVNNLQSEFLTLTDIVAETIIKGMVNHNQQLDTPIFTQIIQSDVKINISEVQLFRYIIKNSLFDLISDIRFEWFPHSIFMDEIIKSEHLDNIKKLMFSDLTFQYENKGTMPQKYEALSTTPFYTRPNRHRHAIQFFKYESDKNITMHICGNLYSDKQRYSQKYTSTFVMMDSVWKISFYFKNYQCFYRLQCDHNWPKIFENEFNLSMTIAGKNKPIHISRKCNGILDGQLLDSQKNLIADNLNELEINRHISFTLKLSFNKLKEVLVEPPKTVSLI